MNPKEKPVNEKNVPKSGTALPITSKQAAKLLKNKYVKQLEQRPEGETTAESQAAGQVEDAGAWAADELASHIVPRQRQLKIKEKPKDVRQATERAGVHSVSTPSSMRGRPVPDDPTPLGLPVIKERGATSAAAGPKQKPDTDAVQSPIYAQGQETIAATGDFPVVSPSSTGQQVQGKAPLDRPSGRPRNTAATPGHPAIRRQAAERIKQDRGQRPPNSPETGHTEAPPASFPGRRSRDRDGFGSTTPKAREKAYSKEIPQPKARGVPAKGIPRPRQRVGQTTRGQMLQAAVQRTQKTARTAEVFLKRAAAATTKAASALASSFAAIAGGSILLIAMVVVIVIAAVASSPFGLFFAQERNAPDTVSVAEAVATVNVSYNARLEELQGGDYDSIEINGQSADWTEVLAVFAVKTAGADTGIDVATLDADRVDRLIDVFWDMNTLTTEVEAIPHEDSDPDDDMDGSWIEHILHIAIIAKTADDMRTAYAFTDYQNSALDDLLADRAALASLAGSLSITNAQAVLGALPADLSPERRAVVEAALTLYGKVNYFWGGKSLMIGWDSRWGQIEKVTAAGSSTTGTYRPYGLDCSGFVDWAFYNATSGGYIIGHGGGAHAQHTNCTTIAWEDALPGDLVFYPEDSHVGIVCGRDEGGNLLVIHCASGANNVVITGTSGFTSIGRPQYFTRYS